MTIIIATIISTHIHMLPYAPLELDATACEATTAAATCEFPTATGSVDVAIICPFIDEVETRDAAGVASARALFAKNPPVKNTAAAITKTKIFEC